MHSSGSGCRAAHKRSKCELKDYRCVLCRECLECLSQKLLKNDMDQAEQFCAGRRKSSLSLDKKSSGWRATVGVLCLFPALALLAALEYPAGAAVQEIQVRRRDLILECLRGEGVSERGAGVFWLEAEI